VFIDIKKYKIDGQLYSSLSVDVHSLISAFELGL